MADLRLRELRRAALAGDHQAGSRLLTERVRTGELKRPALEMAAFLGDSRALEAVGETDYAGPPDDLLTWPKVFCGWGRPALVRLALEAALIIRARGEAQPDRQKTRPYVETLMLIGSYVAGESVPVTADFPRLDFTTEPWMDATKQAFHALFAGELTPTHWSDKFTPTPAITNLQTAYPSISAQEHCQAALRRLRCAERPQGVHCRYDPLWVLPEAAPPTCQCLDLLVDSGLQQELKDRLLGWALGDLYFPAPRA